MNKLMPIVTALALAATLALAGCGKKKQDDGAGTAKGTATEVEKKGPAAGTAAAGSATGSAGASAGSTGVPECDEYIAAAERLANCDKVPPPVLDPLVQGVASMKKSFATWGSLPEGDSKTRAMDSAKTGCKAGTDAINRALTAVGGC